MKFPNAESIASTDIVNTTINDTIEHAIEKMIASEHRDIIVVDNVDYYALAAIEILKLKQEGIKLTEKISSLNLRKIPAVERTTNVLNLLKYLNQLTEFICVINEDKSIYGIITHTDITSNIDPEVILDNYTIEDFLKLSYRVKWITEDVKTIDVLTHMYESGSDSVIIVEDNKPIGILTTKDVVQLIKEEADLLLPIKLYMSSPVDVTHKRTTVRDALDFVKKKHYKRLIVVDDDNTIKGIIAQKELILLTYNRWSLVMKEHQAELQEINTLLQEQNREYELMASVDALTGLYNRHKFKQLFNSSLETMLQRSEVLSLIMLDIDHFKKVNDTYGHNVGDEVLKTIAQILKDETRRVDMVCRWGGEEFVALLPTVSLEQASQIAQKLRVKIKQTSIDIVGNVSASFGIYEVRTKESLEDSIAKADKALYKAKEIGRNRVELFQEL